MTNWILALLWLYACGLMAVLHSQTLGMPATVTMYVGLTITIDPTNSGNSVAGPKFIGKNEFTFTQSNPVQQVS
jgi:hypothetical protein